MNEKDVMVAEKLDGKYVLVTSLDKPPAEIVEFYRSTVRVEQAFRITKRAIRIRPTWSRKKEHIRAHVFVCHMAYLLVSLPQLLARRMDAKMTGLRALQLMARVTKQVVREIPPSREGRQPGASTNRWRSLLVSDDRIG